MDWSPPGSSVHGIFQSRILVWFAISISRGTSRPRYRMQVSYTAGRFFTNWATREGGWSLTHIWHFATHGLQHARLPCTSPTLGAYSNLCRLSQFCHPTISSFVIPFSSCLQSFPASGSFPVSWLFTSGGQSIGTSASASVLPMNIQWILISFRIDRFDFSVQGILQQHSSKASILQWTMFFEVQLSHLYMTTGKTIALTIQIFACKVMPLLFNMLSWFVIVLLPRSRSINFMTTVTICSDFGAQESKICHCFHFLLSICHEVMGPFSMILVFLMLSFKPAFSPFHLHQEAA